MFDSPLISGDVLREVIAKAPRNLDNLDAELLFIDRNYIFHYLEGIGDKLRKSTICQVQSN